MGEERTSGGGCPQAHQGLAHGTTIMIRNIPGEYKPEELIEEVTDLMGFTDLFDFLYLPWDAASNGNKGYAFVNFHSPQLAQHAILLFSNYTFRLHNTARKTGRVFLAHIQGLENNLWHLQDRAVVHGNHPFAPVVIWKGQKVEPSTIFQALRAQDLRESITAPSSAPGISPHARAVPGEAEPASSSLSSNRTNVAKLFTSDLFEQEEEEECGSEAPRRNPSRIAPSLSAPGLSTAATSVQPDPPAQDRPGSSMGFLRHRPTLPPTPEGPLEPSESQPHVQGGDATSIWTRSLAPPPHPLGAQDASASRTSLWKADVELATAAFRPADASSEGHHASPFCSKQGAAREIQARSASRDALQKFLIKFSS